MANEINDDSILQIVTIVAENTSAITALQKITFETK
jgi:hypothetical protein